MGVMQREVFEAFRDIGVQEDKALKAAGALAKRDDDVASIKSDMQVLKWSQGIQTAFLIAIIPKLFLPHSSGMRSVRIGFAGRIPL